MKQFSMVAFALCTALALVTTGCKYGDDESQSGVDPNQVAEVASDVPATAEGQDVSSQVGNDLATADSTSLESVTGTGFDQDPNYTRCTDVDFSPVYFGFDASNIPSSELAKIEAVAKHLADHPTRVVIVEGNCDERGSNEYNLSLGQLRANSILEYLVRLGVTENRIQTKSYGEEKPAVMGQGESAWSKNRRGEFAVFQHK